MRLHDLPRQPKGHCRWCGKRISFCDNSGHKIIVEDTDWLCRRVRELEGENEELRKVADAMHAELQEDVKYIRDLHREAPAEGGE